MLFIHVCIAGASRQDNGLNAVFVADGQFGGARTVSLPGFAPRTL